MPERVVHVEGLADLDALGAVINGIHALSREVSDIPEEDARSINMLAMLAMQEWRKLDAARGLRLAS